MNTGMRIDHGKMHKSPLKPVDGAIASLTKPQVTDGELNELIYKAECIVFPGTMVHVCCLTLTNGTHVFGFGSDIEQPNAKNDKDLAISNARNKLWELYAQQIHDRKELAKFRTKIQELAGWCYADACVSLDAGEDYRKKAFPDIWERAKKDLNIYSTEENHDENGDSQANQDEQE